jgi:hypothetical protein
MRTGVGRIFQTALGRLTILSMASALIAGTIWAWRTSPYYLLPDQYLTTFKPEETFARAKAVNSIFDRTLIGVC